VPRHLGFNDDQSCRSNEPAQIIPKADVAVLRSILQRDTSRVEWILLVALELVL